MTTFAKMIRNALATTTLLVVGLSVFIRMLPLISPEAYVKLQSVMAEVIEEGGGQDSLFGKAASRVAGTNGAQVTYIQPAPAKPGQGNSSLQALKDRTRYETNSFSGGHKMVRVGE